MDVFSLRNGIINDYSNYVGSFINIKDQRILEKVDMELKDGLLWPEPLLQLNPNFLRGASVNELIKQGVLHEMCSKIFCIKKSDTIKELHLHRHQEDAVRAAASGESYVLTTGTGSGKSLSYIIPIVDHVLKSGSNNKKIKAIIIYPMNALANSQAKELEKFLKIGFPEGKSPVSYASFTGQEKEEQRQAIKENPPDILLTNYVMMELLLTRPYDKHIIDAAQGLRFLVLDELHTYRGRQGADVALLVRRIRDRMENPNLQCVGTSATLAGGGSFEEQQEQVASAASRIFGTTVKPERVIGETLRRVTDDFNLSDNTFVAELTSRVKDLQKSIATDFSEFCKDPLARWIESTFGIELEENIGRLRRAVPAGIRGANGASGRLASLTGISEDDCANAIQRVLLSGYKVKHPDTGFPVFAFRLHQFIGRGDTVYASLEEAEKRHITTKGQQYVPGDRSKVLLPLAFCRDCGQEYYTVRKIQDAATGHNAVVPRGLTETLSDNEGINGFIYFSSENPWPDEDVDEVLNRVPEFWLELSDEQRTLKRDAQKKLPSCLTLDSLGKESEKGLNCQFLKTPFDFCLNCGVTFSSRSKSDYGKLSTLSSEGRSTATTILSLSALRKLKKEEALKEEARKILSFTDNRQDASLQAGHFNDFIQVSMLRAAIYKAISTAGEQGVSYDDLTQKVFLALNLPFKDYAFNPEEKFNLKKDTEKAFREIIGYRIYKDLQRGWRITAPNLEQCGLLEIQYSSLDELCNDEESWQNCHPALQSLLPKERYDISKVLLDYLRRELCIKIDCLDPSYQDVLILRSKQKLIEPWALDEAEVLEKAKIALPCSKRQGDYGSILYISAKGGLGRYIKQMIKKTQKDFKDREIEEVMPQLFKILGTGILQTVQEASQEKDVPGYQLPASSFIWRAGDGTKPFHDPIRVPRLPEGGSSTNRFFVEYYKSIASELAGFEAREHTAQVHYDDRQEREERFRTADLPILFCSPTMELGVDIAELNAVNMRNVPPTPANYAQRSGRAGRSGQPALVYTYCTSGSPHDQYFFKQPELMVSGAVSTPRIDLANEDLIKAHVYSVWLAETGESLGRSLTDVLEVNGDAPTLALKENIRLAIESETARNNTSERLKRIFKTLVEELSAGDWYTEEWLEHTLDSVGKELESACERWRGLFRAALKQLDTQHKIIMNMSRTAKDKEVAQRLYNEAFAQINLLKENSSGFEHSDFYSYRYFAGEGFLPGYNFPRLPLSAYIHGKRKKKGTKDEFISRPRFLAISEFGPRSVIYHEGVRYSISKVLLPVGEDIFTRSAKLCPSCGYLHPYNADRPEYDICEQCNTQLDNTIGNLLRLQNVSTKRRERINSDEEERQRFGYEIKTAIRFNDHCNNSPTRTAEVNGKDGAILLKMAYGHSATLWRINMGWRKRSEKSRYGFILDKERGYWAKNDMDEGDAEDPMSAQSIRVVPFVEDWRNSLIISPGDSLSTNEMASLQFAIKNAIQILYQLEDDELAAESLPSAQDRRYILLYESAEGGAGILRLLVDDPGAIKKVAREALKLCHFNPDTGEDLGLTGNGKEGCEAACYDCLMSYYNQTEHQNLDRKLIRDLLLQIAEAEVKVSPCRLSREEHIEKLRALCDSELEKEWLGFIEKHSLNLPDAAQKLIEDCGTRPDFYYNKSKVAVYIDGPDHDTKDICENDGEIEEKLWEKGYQYIRFRYNEKDKWLEKCGNQPSVFGKISETSRI